MTPDEEWLSGLGLKEVDTNTTSLRRWSRTDPDIAVDLFVGCPELGWEATVVDSTATGNTAQQAVEEALSYAVNYVAELQGEVDRARALLAKKPA